MVLSFQSPSQERYHIYRGDVSQLFQDDVMRRKMRYLHLCQGQKWGIRFGRGDAPSENPLTTFHSLARACRRERLQQGAKIYVSNYSKSYVGLPRVSAI